MILQVGFRVQVQGQFRVSGLGFWTKAMNRERGSFEGLYKGSIGVLQGFYHKRFVRLGAFPC